MHIYICRHTPASFDKRFKGLNLRWICRSLCSCWPLVAVWSIFSMSGPCFVYLVHAYWDVHAAHQWCDTQSYQWRHTILLIYSLCECSKTNGNAPTKAEEEEEFFESKNGCKQYRFQKQRERETWNTFRTFRWITQKANITLAKFTRKHHRATLRKGYKQTALKDQLISCCFFKII